MSGPTHSHTHTHTKTRARIRAHARPRIRSSPPIALAAIAVALLGGCGGATKTVSVAGAPTTPAAAAPTGATGATGAAMPPTTRTTTASTGATSGASSGGTPASTRTATAPAFAEKEKGATTAEGLPAALAVVRAHGYTASDTSDYHPSQTLRVLVGTTGSHSGSGYDAQAFFFVDGRYLGTDASRPSAQVSVVSQSDTEVTLAYRLYRPDDPLCCPGGGTAHVRFQLNNGRLVALDPIPPVSSTTGASRQ